MMVASRRSVTALVLVALLVIPLNRATAGSLSPRRVFAWGGLNPLVPTAILSDDFIAVSGGGYHSLALKADGTVWSWGINDHGQLGDGSDASRLYPAKVVGLSNVSAISAGTFHNLALVSGTVWAWGDNSRGQLGDGSTTRRPLPVQVPGLTGVTDISAGLYHSLTVIGGTVWSWGGNNWGQLGDGTDTDRHSPGPALLAGASAVSAGSEHSLAIAGGSVFAWGFNSSGQLGQGDGYRRTIPTLVPGVAGAAAISGGGQHSIAMSANGIVWAWGNNSWGQLGDGTRSNRYLPIVVLPFGTTVLATAISAGRYFNLVAVNGGLEVWAWGENQYGQLGDGTRVARFTPAPIAGFYARHVDAGDGHSMALSQIAPAPNADSCDSGTMLFEQNAAAVKAKVYVHSPEPSQQMVCFRVWWADQGVGGNVFAQEPSFSSPDVNVAFGDQCGSGLLLEQSVLGTPIALKMVESESEVRVCWMANEIWTSLIVTEGEVTPPVLQINPDS